MISHGKDIKIFTGNANPKLAADICKIIGTKLGESEVKSFADGEASVSLYETVRGSDVSQPFFTVCRVRASASASSGTSSVMVEPAAI